LLGRWETYFQESVKGKSGLEKIQTKGEKNWKGGRMRSKVSRQLTEKALKKRNGPRRKKNGVVSLPTRGRPSKSENEEQEGKKAKAPGGTCSGC